VVTPVTLPSWLNGSLPQQLGQCLNPNSYVSRLGEPEQMAFGHLDDRLGDVLLLQPRRIRMTSEILTQCDQLAAHIQVIDRACFIPVLMIVMTLEASSAGYPVPPTCSGSPSFSKACFRVAGPAIWGHARPA
jgi:hypothetical protein